MTETERTIAPASREAKMRAQGRWDAVSKPKGSLGLLEELIVRIAGAQGTENVDISRRVCLVFAADNGIVDERISQSSRDLTAAVAGHIARGCGNINTMAKSCGCDVICVDVGINSEYMPVRPEQMIDLHVSDGTNNFLFEPAMTENQARQAFEAGVLMAERIFREGYRIACAGEMGIGNTTTSAAVIAAICGLDARELVGRGGGLDDAGLERKKDVVERGLCKYGFNRQAYVPKLCEETRGRDTQKCPPDLADDTTVSEYAWNVLRCVGGYDIAAIAGFYTGCAGHNIPVVLDGLITAAAALVACCLHRNVREYLIASHVGREKGSAAALEFLGLSAILHADLALGEGTGAILLLPVLDAALAEYRSALTFSAMGFMTDDDAEDGIRVFTNK